MPVMKCQRDGRPGWKWGESGHCYTYEPGNEQGSKRAHAQAEKQGRAIKATMSPREKVAEGLKERRQGT